MQRKRKNKPKDEGDLVLLPHDPAICESVRRSRDGTLSAPVYALGHLSLWERQGKARCQQKNKPHPRWDAVYAVIYRAALIFSIMASYSASVR